MGNQWRQWPHVATAKFTTESTLDPDGNVIIGVETVREYKCRYRQNPGSKSIVTIDGQTVIYKGTILIKDHETNLKYGDLISVEGFIGFAPIIQVMPHQSRPRIIV